MYVFKMRLVTVTGKNERSAPSTFTQAVARRRRRRQCIFFFVRPPLKFKDEVLDDDAATDADASVVVSSMSSGS